MTPYLSRDSPIQDISPDNHSVSFRIQFRKSSLILFSW